MATQSNYPESFDGYLRYAIETQFAYFGGTHEATTLMLLVKLKANVPAKKFVSAMESVSPSVAFSLGPTAFADRAEMPSRYLTVRGSFNLVGDPTWPVWDALTQFVELSMPVQPGVGPQTKAIDKDRPRSNAEKVIAIIDDGCAFAHERFRVNASGTPSRVFAIWDQSRRNAPPEAMLAGKTFGVRPIDFDYGLEYRRASSSTQIGIDQWIAFHTMNGSVQEDACYREAGFESLRRAISHGAHVMDVLAGSVPPSSRLSYDPKRPPSFATASDEAGQGSTDIIFVQISREAVEDASGRWLSTQVTEAMIYILSCINPARTKTLLVNLSYGPTTEPHDGSANLEEKLLEFTAHYDGVNHDPKLDIFLPAGNSRLSEGHVVFRSASAGDTFRWTWRAPPDNPVPVFAELWVSKAHASAVSGFLYAPAPIPANHQKPTISLTPGLPNSVGWVITLPPTQPTTLGPPPGPHGDWEIDITLAQAGVELHAYVARSEPNLGALVQAKQSRFIDPRWEASQGGASRQTLKDGVHDTSGSHVERTGTFNGIATASDPQTHVAAGYRLSDGVSSRYSSLGPTRNPSRNGPDQALPTDESDALPGIRAAGNFSGGTFRLVGTSTASPQLARRHLDSALAACALVNQTIDIGCGKLPAP